MSNPSCSIGEMTAALKGASDAKSGNFVQDQKGMSQTEREHYQNGYQRVQTKVDALVQEGTRNPIKMACELIAPSTLYGDDIVAKVNQIYESNASLRDKQEAIRNLGKIQIDKVSNFLKVPFANYITQRSDALMAMPKPTGLAAGFNNVLGSMYSSMMKNNPETSILHVLGGVQRLISGDMDSLGTNAFQGLLKAAQQMGDAPKMNFWKNEGGLLAKADFFVHKAAEETANLKYADNDTMKSQYVSQTSYKYSFGDTPGYLTLGKTFGVTNPMMFGRFWMRSMIDPMSQMWNIARTLKPSVREQDPEAMNKAGFAIRYLLGTTVMNGVLFGAAGTLPAGVNLGLNAMMRGANAITGSSSPDLVETYKTLNAQLPINLIYKATGIDQTEHMMRGIPFEVGYSGITNAGQQFMRSLPKMAQDYQTGNTASLMGHVLGDAATILPFTGAVGMPQILRDATLTRLIRSTSKAVGGEINWEDVPHLWELYSTGQGRTAMQQIKAQEQSQ